MKGMSAIVVRDADQCVCEVGNNIGKGGTVSLTPGDDHLSFRSSIEEVEQHLPFLLSVSIGFINTLKFSEGFFIVKGSPPGYLEL